MLIHDSDELGRCEAKSDQSLQGLAAICQCFQLRLDKNFWLTSNKAPEIQQMYSLNMPVSAVRTKVRQEFERHRYVQQLPVVDMLLFQSHSEFQVWQG